MEARTAYALLLVAAALVAVVACADSEETAVDSQPSSENSSSASQFSTGELELIKGPVSADGTQIIFATPDLGVGDNRIGFVLTSTEG